MNVANQWYVIEMASKGYIAYDCEGRQPIGQALVFYPFPNARPLRVEMGSYKVVVGPTDEQTARTYLQEYCGGAIPF